MCVCVCEGIINMEKNIKRLSLFKNKCYAIVKYIGFFKITIRTMFIYDIAFSK